MKKISAVSLILTLLFSGLNCVNNKVKTMTNPLLQNWDTPFQVPPFSKIKAADYVPAFEKAMKEQNANIDAIINNTEVPTFENTMLPWPIQVNCSIRCQLFFMANWGLIPTTLFKKWQPNYHQSYRVMVMKLA